MPHRTKLTVALVLLSLLLLMACFGSMYSVQRCGGVISSETSTTIHDTIGLPGQTCRYRAVLAGDSALTVRLNRVNGDIDPVLVLEDESGAVLASDDESGGDGNALIDKLTLTEPGTVVIVVSSYGDDTTGEFELVVDINSEPQ